MFFDVVIIGAGAAGLFCAAQAGQRGLKVLLIDHSDKVAEKIRISGGGRCNFTNRDLDLGVAQKYFVGHNPMFCRSALARYTPEHFIALVQKHGLAFHEKHKGQLFCDDSAEDIIRMLLAECAAGQVERWQPCRVKKIDCLSKGKESRYHLQTQRDTVEARNLVIATGGLSIPKTGASDFGYRIARQFDVPVVAQRPGLVPLTFVANIATRNETSSPAGVSLPVCISVYYHTTKNKPRLVEFQEDLLFTHRGLSGPAALQISNYWQPGMTLVTNLVPHIEHLPKLLLDAAKTQPKKHLSTILATWLPARVVEYLFATNLPIGKIDDQGLREVAEMVQFFFWNKFIGGTEGWNKAEVTIGGIDTSALSQQSMECKKQPGLYFIGEVVDITGWLGGYNFQWAWSSAHACAQALQKG